MPHPVEKYLKDLGDIRRTGAGTPEESYYGPLANLLDEIGSKLKPRVRPWPLNMRQRLKEEGSLFEKSDHLVFTKDVEFSSPSATAAVIHGGHQNGLLAWKNKAGKTLKEVEST